MTSYRYRAYGLEISSFLVLPELAAGNPGLLPDITIAEGPVPDTLPDAVFRGKRDEVNRSRHLANLEESNGVRFLIEDGSRITVERRKEPVDEILLGLQILGTAMISAACQRGMATLHAAALSNGREAILIGGLSGMGKSTLAFALWKRGWDLISDDVASLEVSKTPPVVQPGYPRFKLYSKSLELLSTATENLSRIHPSLEKYYVPAGDRFENHPRELKRIFLLAPSEQTRLRPLLRQEMFRELQAHLRPGFRVAQRNWPWLLPALGKIASHAPVRVIERPPQSDLEGLVRLIEEDLKR